MLNFSAKFSKSFSMMQRILLSLMNFLILFYLSWRELSYESDYPEPKTSEPFLIPFFLLSTQSLPNQSINHQVLFEVLTL